MHKSLKDFNACWSRIFRMPVQQNESVIIFNDFRSLKLVILAQQGRLKLLPNDVYELSFP